MLRRLFLLATSLIMTPALHASDIFGNGGDVVNCANSVEMLDLYEGRTQRGIQKDLALSSGTIGEHVNMALARLRTIDPTRADRLQDWADTFEQERVLIPNADLSDINDSAHLAVPIGCTVKQVAIQITPRFPQDPRYIISQDLWDRMSDFDRAALILHEIVYRDALEFGHKNSIASRYLNSLLNSDYFLSATRRDYMEAMHAARFPYLMPINATLHSKKLYLMQQLADEDCYKTEFAEVESPIDAVTDDLTSMWGEYVGIVTHPTYTNYIYWNIYPRHWELVYQGDNEPEQQKLLCVEY